MLKIYIDENCWTCVEAIDERNYLKMKAKEVNIFDVLILYLQPQGKGRNCLAIY